MMNFVDSRWKLYYGFSAANGDSPYQSFESQKSLGIRTVTILPRSEDFFFESLLVGIRVNLQESDNAGEICELVLDGSPGDRPSPR